MDPTSGRFVSEDPVGGQLGAPLTQHRFLYAGSSPIDFVDPTGRFIGMAGLVGGMDILDQIENVYNGMVLAIGDALRLSIQAKSSQMSVEEVMSDYLIGQVGGFVAGKALVGGVRVIASTGRKIVQTIDELPFLRSVGEFSSVTVAASREIDELGRIQSLCAKIPRGSLGAGTGTNSAVRAGMPDGYDAGHLIAKILGGEGGAYSGNIVPIQAAINRGPMAQVEQKLAQQIAQGSEAEITIALRYSGNSDVPSMIRYEVNLDGEITPYTWRNQ